MLHLFYEIYSKKKVKYCEILFQFKINCFLFEYILKCNLFVMKSWFFFYIITPVFSVTWSFINYSDTLIYCSRNISDYYDYVENRLCGLIFWGNNDNILRKQWYIYIYIHTHTHTHTVYTQYIYIYIYIYTVYIYIYIQYIYIYIYKKLLPNTPEKICINVSNFFQHW